MRILYVTSYYKPAYVYGGPVRSISQMCEALARLGAQVTVITTNANGARTLDVPLGQPTNVDGVQVHYYPVVPVPPRSFFYSPAQARACVEQIPQCDIVALETLWTYPMRASVAACQRVRVPYIVPLRGQLMPWALAHKALKKKTYLALFARRYLNRAAALHCTDATEAQATRALNLRSPIFVVPNGVDTSRYTHLPLRGVMRERLGIARGDGVLLFLGRLKTIKRADIAIETLAAAQSVRVTHLILAGPDEDGLTPALESQAARLGCADRVHFTGLLNGDDVLSVLADADLMLMPSDVQESFGMSALEAMAAGVPVLVSEGVPAGRWAEQADAGRQVPSTADAFTSATRELLSYSEQLALMGRRGQELVRREFDLPAVAQQMLAQYEAIVKTGKPLAEVTTEKISVRQRLSVSHF